MSFLPELTRVRTQGGFNRVRIFHPGCRQLLFSLPAIFQTHPSGSSGGTNPESSTLPCDDDVPGVNHRLVLDACHIITNHAAEERNCYLSRDRLGRIPVMPHRNGSLAAGKYYYHPGPPSSRTVANYPIVTDFAAWQYPAEGPPDHWKRPRSVEAALALHREHRCNKPGEFRLAVALNDRSVGCVVTKHCGSESEVSTMTPFLVLSCSLSLVTDCRVYRYRRCPSRSARPRRLVQVPRHGPVQLGPRIRRPGHQRPCQRPPLASRPRIPVRGARLRVLPRGAQRWEISVHDIHLWDVSRLRPAAPPEAGYAPSARV